MPSNYPIKSVSKRSVRPLTAENEKFRLIFSRFQMDNASQVFQRSSPTNEDDRDLDIPLAAESKVFPVQWNELYSRRVALARRYSIV